jgi:sulfite exporter TauE/SafE
MGSGQSRTSQQFLLWGAVLAVPGVFVISEGGAVGWLFAIAGALLVLAGLIGEATRR